MKLNRIPALFAGAAALLLAACSSTEGGPQHAELGPIDNTISTEIVWSTKVGTGTGEHYSRLTPAYNDDTVYVADRHGMVQALNASNGRVKWQRSFSERRPVFGRFFAGEPARISGGLVVAGSYVFFGTENGKAYALNKDSGETVWESSLPGEVLSKPAVGEGRVVFHLGSGLIAGLNAQSGEQVWLHEEEVSLLSLRGTSTPVISNGGVFLGTASGKAIVLIAEGGQLAWEERLSVPSGSTDLERLVDADGSPVHVGTTLYIGTFNGEFSALDLNSGDILWRRDYGSWRAPVRANNRIVLVDQRSHMVSLDRFSGNESWRNNDLYYRSLTEPAVHENYLISGDRFGVLHWVDARSGNLAGRLELNDEPINVSPIVAGDLLIVQSASGHVYAVRYRTRN